MKRKPFAREIVRSITHSWSRFWAIFAIVALGAGFYTGLRATAPDMRLTGDAYFDQSRMMDLHLISTLGFSQDDVDAIRAAEGVENVMAGYSTDAISRIGGKDQVIRIHSLPADRSEENGDYLNRPVLVDGRWPENSGECVLDAGKMSLTGSKVGDIVSIEDSDGKLSDTLKHRDYKIVGLVNSAYYMSFSLGSTNMGNGTLNYYMFVPETEFVPKIYTDLFAAVSGAADLSAFSQKYDDKVGAAAKSLEKLAPARLEIRKDDVVGEARKKLDEGRAEYEKKKAEAEKELDDAKQKLDDGQREIEENEQKLNDSQKEIEEKAKELEDGQAAYETGAAQLAAGKKALEEGQRQLDDGQKQWEAGVEELARSRAETNRQLADAKELLAEKTAELQNAKQQLQNAQAALAASDKLISSLETQISQAEDQLQNITDPELRRQLEETLRWARERLKEAEQARDDAQKELDESAAEVEKAEPQLEAAKKELDEKSIQAEVALALAQQKVDTAGTEISLNRAELSKNKTQLEQSQKQLDESGRQLTEGRKALEQGRTELEQGREKLDEAKEALASGKSEYETGKADAEKQLKDAENKIKDGEREIEELEDPEWYVLDRHTNVGFASFEGDTDRMDSLSTVFPILFFLVAALVALTTMTRMVEEERMLIGTYKALGYGSGKIMSKYLIYAALASLFGSAAGILLGFWSLPAVCWNAYRILYVGPDLLVPFHWDLALGACVVTTACTLLATLWAVWATLRESPAGLMQPRAPKPGKRILLERIGFVWKRLGFTKKVTARNLFRYKKRLFMTIVGIAGCTGLLLTGFGIKDSVSGIIHNQYDEINLYNSMIELKDNSIDSELQAALENPDNFSATLSFSRKSTDVTNNGKTLSAYIAVPQDADALKSFLTMRDRVTHKDVPFGDDSVVLTEKLSRKLGIGVGDTVRLKNSKDREVSFTVTGVTENYVYHYIYIAPGLYEEKMGEAPQYNEVLGISAENTPEALQSLSDELLALHGVGTVSFSDDMSSSFDDMIKSLNSIIVVIILCSGLLAFVVLYNLTNINITERQREIATIKVLGFFNKEVSAYVYRETGVLTVLGCIIGLGLGVLLHLFVIQTVEVDIVMFGRTIAPLSFLWAALLTLLFAVIVSLVMYRKLKRISMVESLKSVD